MLSKPSPLVLKKDPYTIMGRAGSEVKYGDDTTRNTGRARSIMSILNSGVTAVDLVAPMGNDDEGKSLYWDRGKRRFHNPRGP